MSKYSNFIKQNERQIKKTLNLENLDEYKDKEVELLEEFFGKYFENTKVEEEIIKFLEKNQIEDIILLFPEIKYLNSSVSEILKKDIKIPKEGKIEKNKFNETLIQEIKNKKEEYIKISKLTEKEFDKLLEKLESEKDLNKINELIKIPLPKEKVTKEDNQKIFNSSTLIYQNKDFIIDILQISKEAFEKQIDEIDKITNKNERKTEYDNFLLNAIKKKIEEIKNKKEEYAELLKITEEKLEETLKKIEENKNILELKVLEREYYKNLKDLKDLVEKELQYSNKDIKDKIISILIEKELIKDENNLYKEVVSTWKSTYSKQIQTIEKIIEETKSLKVVKEIYNYFEEKNIYLKDFNKIKELLIEAIWNTPDYDYEIISFEASIEDFIEVIKSTKTDIKRDILKIEKNKDIFNDLNKQIDNMIRFWYSSVYKYESYFDLYLGLKDMREMISDYYLREEDELFEKLFTDKFDVINFNDEKLDAYITQLYIFTNFSKKFNEELVIKWLEDIKKNQGDYYLFLRFIISKLTKMYLIEHKKIKELLNEINDKHNKENYRYEILKEKIEGLQ